MMFVKKEYFILLFFAIIVEKRNTCGCGGTLMSWNAHLHNDFSFLGTFT
jgi:hypothetical protein